MIQKALLAGLNFEKKKDALALASNPVPLMLKQRSSQSRSSCSEFSISDNKGATAGKTVESMSLIETPTFEKSIKGSARPETRINAASIRDPRA